jgi:hypothetical protein
MPRLDGVQAARVLAGSAAVDGSRPEQLRRVRAAGLGLPLFDKVEFDALAAWVEQQARTQLAGRTPRSTPSRVGLSCSLCGYGIVIGVPPPQPDVPRDRSVEEPDRVRPAAAPEHAVR